MRHFVKPILLVLECNVVIAVTLAVFVFIKILNYSAHSVYYFYLLAHFVFKPRSENVVALNQCCSR